MKKNGKKKGFTLIELIVVIAILGILAAIAIPRFAGTLTNSKLKSDQSTAKTLVSAVSLAQAENVDFSAAPYNGTAGQPTVAMLVSAGYVDKAPVSQSAGGAFTLHYSAAWTVDAVNVGSTPTNVLP